MESLFLLPSTLPSTPVQDESKELWGIDYAKFSAILLKAIQEQQQRIEELEKNLKSKVR